MFETELGVHNAMIADLAQEQAVRRCIVCQDRLHCADAVDNGSHPSRKSRAVLCGIVNGAAGPFSDTAQGYLDKIAQ